MVRLAKIFRATPPTLRRRLSSTSQVPPKPLPYRKHGSKPANNVVLEPNRTTTQTSTEEPPDPARGLEAAQRYVKEGRVDPKYKPAARRVMAIMCSMPIAIYLTYILYERLVLGVEVKKMPTVGKKEAVADG